MEKYNRKIKKRMWTCIVAIFIIGNIISLDLLNKISPVVSNNNWGDFWQGILLGMTAGIELVLIYFAIRYFTAINDPKRLKEMYIKENDERKLKVVSETSRNTYWYDMFGLVMGIIIGGYFNMYVSLTCLVIAIYLILVRAILYSFYDKKY